MSNNPSGFKITDSTAGWNQADFDDVFVRNDIFVEGNLWLWGDNIVGQLGDNTTLDRSSPVQTISGGNNWKQISLGGATVAAIKTDGTLWLWGSNGNGQLGDNTGTTYRSSPVQTISGGTNWKQVSVGDYFVSAIKTDGSLWLWGSGSNGQLGDNTPPIIYRSSPIQTVSGGTNWKQVSCGYASVAAIKTDGTLWTWGFNTSGQLGDNTVTERSSPVQTVSGGNNWKQVSAGYNFAAAIKTDGSLWLWGSNSNGQLGDNTLTNKSSPVQTISGGNNWKQVSAGSLMTAAIKTDGSLWTWGWNFYGQLGDNTRTERSSPVQTISGGNNWKQVSCVGPNNFSTPYVTAIKTDGTLWNWGRNNDGFLGDNTTTDRSSPVQTITGGTNWKQVTSNGGIRG